MKLHLILFNMLTLVAVLLAACGATPAPTTSPRAGSTTGVTGMPTGGATGAATDDDATGMPSGGATGMPTGDATGTHSIPVTGDGETVILLGVIEDKNDNVWMINPITTEGGALTFIVDPDVITDVSFEVGDLVKVSGRVQANGNIVVSLLEDPSGGDLTTATALARDNDNANNNDNDGGNDNDD